MNSKFMKEAMETYANSILLEKEEKVNYELALTGGEDTKLRIVKDAESTSVVIFFKRKKEIVTVDNALLYPENVVAIVVGEVEDDLKSWVESELTNNYGFEKIDFAETEEDVLSKEDVEDKEDNNSDDEIDGSLDKDVDEDENIDESYNSGSMFKEYLDKGMKESFLYDFMIKNFSEEDLKTYEKIITENYNIDKDSYEDISEFPGLIGERKSIQILEKVLPISKIETILERLGLKGTCGGNRKYDGRGPRYPRYQVSEGIMSDVLGALKDTLSQLSSGDSKKIQQMIDNIEDDEFEREFDRIYNTRLESYITESGYGGVERHELKAIDILLDYFLTKHLDYSDDDKKDIEMVFEKSLEELEDIVMKSKVMKKSIIDPSYRVEYVKILDYLNSQGVIINSSKSDIIDKLYFGDEEYEENDSYDDMINENIFDDAIKALLNVLKKQGIDKKEEEEYNRILHLLNKEIPTSMSDEEYKWHKERVEQIFKNKKSEDDVIPKSHPSNLYHGGRKRIYEFSEAKSIKYDNYVIYHDTYTSAIQEAKKTAEIAGYDLDPEELEREIGFGEGKPVVGETRRHSLSLYKKDKKMKESLHIQVYGMGKGSEEGMEADKYELNLYVL